MNHISAIRFLMVLFTGKALIVGGRGKFSHAIVEVDFKGYYNPTNPDDAECGVEGWIAY